MTKEEILFVTKTEVYKLLLESRPSIKIRGTSYRSNILDEIQAFADVAKKPFTRWLLTSLKSDLEDLYSDAAFKRLQNEILGVVKVRNNATKKLKKKIDFLLPWFEIIDTFGPKELDDRLLDIAFDAIDNITFQSRIILKFSRFMNLEKERQNYTQLAFFKEREKKPDYIEDAPTLEQIIKPVVKLPEPFVLPKPTNDWTPKEDDAIHAKVQVIPTPNPNYVPPKELPKPVDNWNE